MSRVLVVATSRRTRGGITSVIKAHEGGEAWKTFHCHWIQTHRDGAAWGKILYLLAAWGDYLIRLPFYDIVHIHCAMGISLQRKWLFFVLARLLHKKTIVHFHPPGEQYLDKVKGRRELACLFTRADRVLVLSPSWKRLLQEKFGVRDNVQVLFNPCPQVKEGEGGRKENCILFAGTIIKRKGYDTLMRAFAAIASRFPDWRLVYAGNGEIEEAMHLARQLGVLEQVEFLGWVDAEQKERAFQRASIFCLPSRGEGFPMAVLDAWAYGLPVITTPVGGIPDVAEDGENVLLFDSEDVEKLSVQLERLMGDEALRVRLSAASRHFAQFDFNVDTINRQLGELYGVLSSSPKAPAAAVRVEGAPLTILVNAYAINPRWGSEPGMGWNWVTHLSKYCCLHVITEGEWRREIEEEVAKLPQRENLHFYYLPVSDRVRRMCWNQGDWRFYFHYRQWQKRALRLAQDIISQHPIDLLHQLNMIGFREPGYLWKIKGIPFVWGPVGGMELMPMSYFAGAGWKQSIFCTIKNIINVLQYKYHPRVRKAIRRADVLVAAVKGVQDVARRHYNREAILLNETGTVCLQQTRPVHQHEHLDLLWVGKFDFRKQLGLAIRSLAATGNKAVHLHICGSGSEAQVKQYMQLAEQCGVAAQCHWYGQVSHEEVSAKMLQCDVLFFTSIMEGTPAAVLEAISAGLPVLCFHAFGYGHTVRDFAGTAIELTTPEQSVAEFAAEINRLAANRGELERISRQEMEQRASLSWDCKAQKMLALYRETLGRCEKNKSLDP